MRHHHALQRLPWILCLDGTDPIPCDTDRETIRAQDIILGIEEIYTIRLCTLLFPRHRSRGQGDLRIYSESSLSAMAIARCGGASIVRIHLPGDWQP